MAKIISLFNHKGGVSKTTTTFHLGWKLAKLGKKVLIVDADPQCNLTGLTLGISDYESLFGFYDSKQNNDVFSSLAPIFGLDKGGTNSIKSYNVSVTANPNLYILAGHIRLSELDIQIATAITSSGSLPTLRSFIGAFYELISKAASLHNVDIVLVDMSPSVSATNMCLIMGSDYFIVPTSPDFYCYQAIDSLSSVLPNWADKMAQFKTGGLLPFANPKMLGIISQNYRVYTSDKNSHSAGQRTMAVSFQKWADKIREITNNKLVPELKSKDMIISESVFRENVPYDTPYNLANIQDFNSLIAISQKLSKPIYELTKAEVGSGATWLRTNKEKEVGLKVSIEEADAVYTKMANAIIKMISL